jgi:MFS transporter, FSR family, fosmidomycin resistance protein
MMTNNQERKNTGGKKQESLEYKTILVLTLSATHFLHDIYSSFLAPLLPLLIKKLSLSLTEAGFLSTVMQVPALMNPYIGTLADRISVRQFIVLAPALTAVTMSLIGLAPNYGFLLLLLLVAGISVSLFHVPAPVMIARLSGQKKGKGMSFFMTGGELARALGPLAAVGVVSLFGLEHFYPVMIVGVGASVWLHLKFRDIPITVDAAARSSVRETWRKSKFVLLPLTAILAARGFMHASMATFLPTFMKTQTGNLWLAGASLTLFEISGVIGVLSAGSFSDRFGRRKVLLASLAGAPLSLFCFAALSGWIRYVALLFTGFTILSTTPVMLALVQEHAKGSPSAANGLFMMASFIARSAIVVFVGFLGDLLGLRATYFISSFLGLLGIPFALMLPEKRDV